MRKQSARTQIATAKAEREVRKANKTAEVKPSTQKDIEQQREQQLQTIGRTENALTNAGNNGNINLNRQTENVGAFSDLQERISKKTVRNVAKEYGVDMKGVTITVDKNEELLSLPIAGSANANKIGEITFLPNAFKDKETLIRTLFHEKKHVEQYREYGAEFVAANSERFEREAYEEEEKFIIELKKRGVL